MQHKLAEYQMETKQHDHHQVQLQHKFQLAEYQMQHKLTEYQMEI